MNIFIISVGHFFVKYCNSVLHVLHTGIETEL